MGDTYAGLYRTAHEDDIALLKLAEPIQFNRYVQPICLPDQDYKFEDEQPFVVVGWGRLDQHDINYAEKLHQVVIPLVSDKVCSSKDYYGERFAPGKQICCGYAKGGKDSCQGDSGGGLVFNKNGKWYQGGVVSWGDGCANKNKPGIYTNVPRYVNWIKETISKN